MDDAGHAFDFWIGEWEVFTADGDLLGRNTMSPVLGTGAPAEHSRGAKSIEGRSLTAWDGGRMGRPSPRLMGQLSDLGAVASRAPGTAL
jgi:hypothetical protein